MLWRIFLILYIFLVFIPTVLEHGYLLTHNQIALSSIFALATVSVNMLGLICYIFRKRFIFSNAWFIYLVFYFGGLLYFNYQTLAHITDRVFWQNGVLTYAAFFFYFIPVCYALVQLGMYTAKPKEKVEPVKNTNDLGITMDQPLPEKKIEIEGPEYGGGLFKNGLLFIIILLLGLLTISRFFPQVPFILFSKVFFSSQQAKAADTKLQTRTLQPAQLKGQDLAFYGIKFTSPFKDLVSSKDDKGLAVLAYKDKKSIIIDSAFDQTDVVKQLGKDNIQRLFGNNVSAYELYKEIFSTTLHDVSFFAPSSDISRKLTFLVIKIITLPSDSKIPIQLEEFQTAYIKGFVISYSGVYPTYMIRFFDDPNSQHELVITGPDIAAGDIDYIISTLHTEKTPTLAEIVQQKINANPLYGADDGTFDSVGKVVIEKGITCEVDQGYSVGKQIKIKLLITNTQLTPQKIAVGNIMMLGQKSAATNEEKIGSVDFTPGEVKEFILTYTRLPDPPYTFVYETTAKQVVKLGRYGYQ